MAAQELLRASERDAEGLVVQPTATPGEIDAGFRVASRAGLLVLVLALDALGTLALWRFSRERRVRAVSGRLLALLVAGLALLDLAYLFDGRFLVAAPYAARALFVSWIYPVGAILAAGSVLRLLDVEAMMLGAPPRAG